MRRSISTTWVGVALWCAGCVCSTPIEPDAGLAIDAGPVDSGSLDAGVDAGARDAGFLDAGTSDAGRDGGGGNDGGNDGGGLVDAGVDAGPPLTCAMVLCEPWQTCSEVTGTARCSGTVSITWVSPVAGASAPSDLFEIPIAIDTSASGGVDVPWAADGVLVAGGVFSGQRGIRSDRLPLADADAGVVRLTAGWSGGPTVTTSFVLTAPIVRPLTVPSGPAPGAGFEPNDPAGHAFRRDEVVPLEIGELPLPISLNARLDAPGAQTLSLPVTQRCDAGACWRVDLDLRALHFPAFRGHVLLWASGADGGVQTRPRQLPVTRWRWRRQISAVPVPLALSRPVAGGVFQIAIGSVDTATSGGVVHLNPNGTLAVLPAQFAPFGGEATGALSGSPPAVVAVTRAAGSFMEPFTRPLDGAGLLCSTSGGLSACVTASGEMSTLVSQGGVRFGTFPTCGLRPVGLLMAREDSAIVTENGPVCVARFAWPQVFATASPTAGSYRPVFARDQQFALGMIIAGTDGGLWSLERSGAAIVEAPIWDGGLVDAVAAITRQVQPVPSPQSFWLYWATDDRRVHTARYRLAGQRPQVLQNELVAPDLLPDRVASSPVVAQVLPPSGLAPAPGTAVFVGRGGAVSAYDTDTLRLLWRLEAGDAGVRGGRVEGSPIAHTSCGRSGSVLIPSIGDGSLYSFILDGSEFTWVAGDPWAMAGRSPENEQEVPVQRCLAD